MNGSLLLPIILQLVGVVVIIAEVILPSFGILTIVALGVFGYSLFMVFQDISKAAGFALLAADLVLIPVLVILGLKLLARSPVTLRKTLSREGGFPPSLPIWTAILICKEPPSRTFVLQERRLLTEKELMWSPVESILKKMLRLLLPQ